MKHVLPLLAHTPTASTVEVANRYLAALVTASSAAATGSYFNRDRSEPSFAESRNERYEEQLIACLNTLLPGSR